MASASCASRSHSRSRGCPAPGCHPRTSTSADAGDRARWRARGASPRPASAGRPRRRATCACRMSGRTPSRRRSRQRRCSMAAAATPSTCGRRKGSWRCRSRSGCGAARGGAAVYDARDLATQSARFARLPGPWRALLQRRERDWARSMDDVVTVSTPYADVLGARLGAPAADHLERPLRLRSPPTRRVACGTSAWASRPGHRSCSTWAWCSTGGASRSCARPSGWCPGAVLVVAGYGADYERFRSAAAALPHADRIHFPGPVAPADILDCHRGRGRVGDARRGRHPQPPAQHAHQAVRCHGRGRAGGRQRPAGHGAHRARRPAVASCATRPTRRTSRAPSGPSSTPRRSAAPPIARPACGGP